MWVVLSSRFIILLVVKMRVTMSTDFAPPFILRQPLTNSSMPMVPDSSSSRRLNRSFACSASIPSLSRVLRTSGVSTICSNSPWSIEPEPSSSQVLKISPSAFTWCSVSSMSSWMTMSLSSLAAFMAASQKTPVRTLRTPKIMNAMNITQTKVYIMPPGRSETGCATSAHSAPPEMVRKRVSIVLRIPPYHLCRASYRVSSSSR
mmetsp:Transcript_14705/g.44108  ORF Transcript_14705/g.44108 Transcript_14705/m.44108 type:complete len:204 (+) Transcript_14705:384-995(+)